MSTKSKTKNFAKKKQRIRNNRNPRIEDKAKRKSFLKKRMTDFKTKQKTQEH